MKKLFLVLLLTMPLMAQINTVNNTTQLSAFEGQGICIVQAWDASGGIYTSIDSTYAEGTFAFDHLYLGKQWAKLGSFANADFLTLKGSNGETISNAVNGRMDFNDANLLTTGTLGAGATTTTTLSATTISGTTLTTVGTALLKTGTGGSSSDSSLVFTSSTGSPLLTWYGTDGDAVAVGISTGDQLQFSGGTGGYDFSGTVSATTVNATTIGAGILGGSLTATDSTTSAIIKDSGGKKWKLRVNTEGVIRADSVGLN